MMILPTFNEKKKKKKFKLKIAFNKKINMICEK